MATKYQCEKAIKQLIEKGSDDPNVQGYGIGRAKDYGLDDKVGYVVLVYTETAPKKITPAGDMETGAADKQDAPPKPKAAKSAAKKTDSRTPSKRKSRGIGTNGLRKTVGKKQKPKAVEKPKPEVKAKPAKVVKKEQKIVKEDKPKIAAAAAEPLYPDKVETTSRKKKVQVPLEYIETGKFGFS